jgi:hypothetical protein
MTDPPPPGDPSGAGPQPPRLLDQLRQAALAHFGRPEPGQRFADWARRFILFHDKRHPSTLGAAEIEPFLTDLAVNGPISARRQNQAGPPG